METTRDFRQVAQSWLDGNYDQQTKDEVRALMAGDQTALEDAFYRNLEFGTGGLRGVMGVGTNRMNKYTVGMATQGLANYIRKHCTGDDIKVCVSYDCRNHSREFAKITADVFYSYGLHVYMFENLRPTPDLSYSIRKMCAQSGVMV